jgi:DNA replicative helicase MCM subunit Mcm2 (Cdc46/Mcm family)
MTNSILEVSDCLILDIGNASVLGIVTSISRLYEMLKSVNYYCSDCGSSDTELFDAAVDLSDSNWKPIIKSSKKCNCERSIQHTFDYVNAVTIELQDFDDLKKTDIESQQIEAILVDKIKRIWEL